MHREVSNFIKSVRRKYWWFFKNHSVLEIGSLNINGGNRKHFYNLWKGKYVGMDIVPGKGVDVVGYIHSYIVDEQYDVLISTEVAEHDKYYPETLKAMYNVLKPGGLFIFTCAGPHRAEHGTKRTEPFCSPATPDYYRNLSTEDFESVLPNELFSEYVLQYDRGKMDLQFFGIKKKGPTSKEIYQKLMNL